MREFSLSSRDGDKIRNWLTFCILDGEDVIGTRIWVWVKGKRGGREKPSDLSEMFSATWWFPLWLHTLSSGGLSSGPGFEDCSEGSQGSFSPGVLPFIFRVCVLKMRNRQQVIKLCFWEIRICSPWYPYGFVSSIYRDQSIRSHIPPSLAINCGSQADLVIINSLDWKIISQIHPPNKYCHKALSAFPKQ